jgi:GNAT superfamily N-acetyltransferase
MDHYVLVSGDYTGDFKDTWRIIEKILGTRPSPIVIRWLLEVEKSGWRSAITRLGFNLSGSDVIMAADLANHNTPYMPEPWITIEKIDHTSYDLALEIVQKVFGGPAAITRFFAPPDITQFFLARWNRHPVAAASLWPFTAVAGIFSVATLPEMRRHGLATALVRTILHEAARTGFQLGGLRCNDELVPLYSQCGFRPVGRVLSFVRHPDNY